MSFPNQKKVVIHKEKCQVDFLQVKNIEWQFACRVLTPAAFKIYLYLTSNKDGFHLWLSREDVYEKVGIAKTAYYSALKELERFGYLIERTPSIYEFSTTPIKSDSAIIAWKQRLLNPRFLTYKGVVPNCGNDGHTFGTFFPATSKEIYNKNINREITEAANCRYGNFEMEPFDDWFARLPERERDLSNM